MNCKGCRKNMRKMKTIQKPATYKPSRLCPKCLVQYRYAASRKMSVVESTMHLWNEEIARPPPPYPTEKCRYCDKEMKITTFSKKRVLLAEQMCSACFKRYKDMCSEKKDSLEEAFDFWTQELNQAVSLIEKQ